LYAKFAPSTVTATAVSQIMFARSGRGIFWFEKTPAEDLTYQYAIRNARLIDAENSR